MKQKALPALAFSRNVQLRHLRCFVAIAQERHLARAAERLAVSQPAISKTLTELEELAGARLVERSSAGRRGVQGLTPIGEQLLAHALRVLEAVDAGAQAIAPAAGARLERLRIGALPSVAPALLPQALAKLRAHWPALQVMVKSATNAVLLDELRAGELDLVAGRISDPHLMTGLSFELLYTEPLVFAVRKGHPLARRVGSVQAVLGFPLVIYGQGTIPRHNTESFFSSRGLAVPPDALQTLDLMVARALVAASDAVWVTPLGAARDDFQAGTLMKLRIDTPGTEEPVGLLMRSEASSSAACSAMVGLLREAARQGQPKTARPARPVKAGAARKQSAS
ncbi:LysR substrate-binding domain-containing protein [Variovorax robiniae]|uniref:LysR substrate-binding domain-containing protein n=1 Tax=Variovorax robiniae TaxID=1836199 RepID=A0ABU8X7E4_9BURK